ncbi:hypothetical protein EG328_009255 [Venturia inaequalis]|uniref:RFX-type winged-helix domain-containing protein n=2 Tax=Venturia inaequalis TaxID=5025 RepID=A0A8H3UAC0_VENIN|nr:hypothetical protein EG328_009255 [Venturia inaequalis]
MAGQTRRSRSTTAASQRPASRGSTASVHSGHTQHQHQHIESAYRVSPYNGLPIAPNNHQMGTDYSAHQQSIIQNAANGVNAQDSFDSQALQMSMSGHIPPHFQSQDTSQFYQPSQVPYIAQQPAVDYSYMPSQPPTSAPADPKAKKTGSQSSQTNDKELRELLSANIHRTLSDVAIEVLSTERTPRAEKTKQLFAMLWLGNSCESAKTSVPRGRVYSTYANGCAAERVQPLNPASFGKLVRVIFPGIATRRLGVRGESKYHYVDLALKDDVTGIEGMPRGVDLAPQQPNSGNALAISRPSMDPTSILIEDQPLPSPELSAFHTSNRPDGYIFVDPPEPGFHPPRLLTSNMYAQHLEFNPPPATQSSDVLDMPDIWLWASRETDVDAANALVALYRSHCTSLVDSVRFCKEKTFFKLFKTFQGTLTVPVGKLFADPKVAGWVRECDWLVYQKMLEQLYSLTLQVMPVQVMRFLDNIARALHLHITQNYGSCPRYLLEAKLEPANLFSELVGRMLKVNQTAHAAARVVESREFRESLLKDWVQYVNPKRIMESELPGCGYTEAYKIITEDIPSLLSPIPRDVWSGSDTHYRDMVLPISDEQEPAEPIVDKIGSWLSLLPSRFPNASARTLVDCIKNIGTAAMRDMTIGGAQSFNAWWILKVYIDEMVQWLASSGGFLSHRSSHHGRSPSPSSNAGAPLQNETHDNHGPGFSQQASQFGSMDVDMSSSHSAQMPTHHVHPGHVTRGSQHRVNTSNQHGPHSEPMPSVPPHISQKRRSQDSAHDSRSSSPGKRLRFSQDDSQIMFEQNPSFATSSFNPGPEPGPQSSHDMHDDSGIDLSAYMEGNYEITKDVDQPVHSIDDRLKAAIASQSES